MKLTNITLVTKAGQTVELTINEARDLYEQLAELFGPKYTPSTPIVIERDHWPWPGRWQPYWYESPTCSPPGRQWEVTCGVGTKAPSGLEVLYGGMP